MFAGCQGRLRHRVVQQVGRRQVDDVDVRIGQHGIERIINTGDAQLVRLEACIFRGIFSQAEYLDPDAANSLHMGRTDKTGSRNADTDGLFIDVLSHVFSGEFSICLFSKQPVIHLFGGFQTHPGSRRWLSRRSGCSRHRSLPGGHPECARRLPLSAGRAG